jgi:hypothetical protein
VPTIRGASDWPDFGADALRRAALALPFHVGVPQLHERIVNRRVKSRLNRFEVHPVPIGGQLDTRGKPRSHVLNEHGGRRGIAGAHAPAEHKPSLRSDGGEGPGIAGALGAAIALRR